MYGRNRHVGSVIAMALMVTVAVGCVGEKGVSPAVRSADATLGSITVSPLNAIMAVGDTLRVTFAGKTIGGAPVTSYDSVWYMLHSVTDTLRVNLTSTGLLTALSPSDANRPVLVDVYAFKDGVAAADQAVVQVTGTAFTGATLSIHPVAPDSAKLALGTTKTIVPVISNGAGGSVSRPTIRFSVTHAEFQYIVSYVPSFPDMPALSAAQLNFTDYGPLTYIRLNQIYPISRPGTLWVRANVTVYGVPLTDSVLYTFTYPYGAGVQVDPIGLAASNDNRGSIYIAPGGDVNFYNNFDPSLSATVTFTFDNPDAALAADPPSETGGASGNITALASYEYTDRVFRTPGTYTWTATVAGSVPPFTGATIKGKIVVQ